MDKYFVTSFGRKIKIIDGFFDKHQKAPPVVWDADADSNPANRNILPYAGFRKDVFYYSLMVDMFSAIGIDLKVGSLLDVGGAEGAIARLARMEGRAQHTHVVELHDMRPLLPEDVFESYVSKMRRHIFLSRRGFKRYDFIKNPESFKNHKVLISQDSSYFNINRRNDPRIDNYSLRDFYEMEGSFDMITAFSSVDYFDVQAWFCKAAELLNEGGMVFVLLVYWWFPVNCALIFGDFPYASQRLTREDFERYLQEFRPDIFESTMERYNYFHLGKHHPTFDEYIEYADRAGLSLLAGRRIISDAPKMNPYSPREFNQYDDTSLNDVLEDIRQFNGRVGLSDLYTFNVILGFEKRGQRSASLSETLGQKKG